jgi:hypothetical protein
MSLVPVDKQTGRKRQVNEQDRGALRKAKERADWNRRNPDSKWKR